MRNTTTYLLILVCTIYLPPTQAQNKLTTTPNFVIVFADDLGYGDLGAYGHPTIRTPNLDRLATEGQRWTNFYVGASVCTPSRAALMTGRLPVRNGMMSRERRVLFPNSVNGLPPEEVTIAEQLKGAGYATACIGKWHLGHQTPYLPTDQGFDTYFGIPYSNDMDRLVGVNGHQEYMDFWKSPASKSVESFHVPLMRDKEIIERPADQTTITRRYADEAIEFIKEKKDGPFFLYLAHNLPHVPLFASPEFVGKSARGLYGDVVEEIDHGIGRIIATLEEEGLAENTVFVFTSDNGPWLIFDEDGGSAGLLREGKGSTWEGGMREPCIMWSPGNISPAVVTDLGTTMDLFTTFSLLAGQAIPTDRVMDGVDLTATLLKGEKSPREVVFYYRSEDLYAVRSGDYKAHFITEGAYGGTPRTVHESPLLFNLQTDPSEKYDIATGHPEVIERIREIIKRHEANLVRGPDQLVGIEEGE